MENTGATCSFVCTCLFSSGLGRLDRYAGGDLFDCFRPSKITPKLLTTAEDRLIKAHCSKRRPFIPLFCKYSYTSLLLRDTSSAPIIISLVVAMREASPRRIAYKPTFFKEQSNCLKGLCHGLLSY